MGPETMTGRKIKYLGFPLDALKAREGRFVSLLLFPVLMAVNGW
jgi:hypothetical protein